MDGWMDGWMGGWVDGWAGRWMDRWIDRWMCGYVDVLLNRWIGVSGWLDRFDGFDWWMNGWWLEEWIEGKKVGRKIVWILDGWMEVLTSRLINTGIDRRMFGYVSG